MNRLTTRRFAVALTIVAVAPACRRIERAVHAATADPEAPTANALAAASQQATPIAQMPTVSGTPVFVADTGVTITDVAAPTDALALAGRPLGSRFAPLLVGGSVAPPVSATPVQSSNVMLKRVERGSAASAALTVAGIGSAGVSAAENEAQVMLVVTKIEQELEFAPPTSTANGATYYIRKIRLGRAFYLTLTARTETIEAVMAGRHSNAELQTRLQTHASELRISASERGLHPRQPLSGAASVSLDATNGYDEVGSPTPILVDYWSIPGTAQAEAHTYRVELRATATSVGTDPLNQRPRWQLLARCARGDQPTVPEATDRTGIWFDGEANRGSSLLPNQPAFQAFSGAIADGESLRCALGGVHHGGMLGSTNFDQVEFEWTPGSARTQNVTLSADRGNLSATVTVRIRQE